MSNTDFSSLDSEELLQLAVLDSGAGRHDTAIVKLKQAIVSDPGNARAHYMLGAEHAEIGLLDRAIAEMTHAVDLDPGLETAHFQLGLLHYTQGNLELATQRWRPLDGLGEQHALYLFKDGLLKLGHSELKAAEQQLSQASQASQGLTAPLRADIGKVLGNVRKHMAEQAAVATDESPDSASYGSNLARRYGELDS